MNFNGLYSRNVRIYTLKTKINITSALTRFFAGRFEILIIINFCMVGRGNKVDARCEKPGIQEKIFWLEKLA